MIKKYVHPIGLLCVVLLFISCKKNEVINLFDGKSLECWEGSTTFFRVEQGAIIGGDLENPIDKSYYLCTKKNMGILN